MARTKDRAEAVRPYVKRAMEDPELRDDLMAAFAAARELYEKVSKGDGVKGKAQKISSKTSRRSSTSSSRVSPMRRIASRARRRATRRATSRC